MPQLLSAYEVQLRQVNQSYMRGRCPLAQHTSEATDTFGVNTEKNIWGCQSGSCAAARGGKKGGNVLD
jgi:hypothetical protein